MTKGHTFYDVIRCVTNLAVAMSLMIWGTMNLVSNGFVVFHTKPGASWAATLVFALLFSIVPFAIGLWIASHTVRKKKAS
jgi:hypothetical protein